MGAHCFQALSTQATPDHVEKTLKTVYFQGKSHRIVAIWLKHMQVTKAHLVKLTIWRVVVVLDL